MRDCEHAIPLQCVRIACMCLAVLASACLYDDDHRCGRERVLQGLICVCKPGFVERASACEPAPPATDAGACQPGSTCDQDKDCCQGDHPLCRMSASGVGYCTTSDCQTSEDCPGGFFCAVEPEGSYCSRMPTGQGEHCESSTDCKGFDASFCGVGDPRGATCWVPNCTDQSCAPGYTCFDLSPYIPGAPKVCAQ